MVIYITLHTAMKLLIKSYEPHMMLLSHPSLPHHLALGCTSTPFALPSHNKSFQHRPDVWLYSDVESSRWLKEHHFSIPVGLGLQASLSSIDACAPSVSWSHLYLILFIILLFQDPLFLPHLCFPYPSLLPNSQATWIISSSLVISSSVLPHP